MATLVSLHYFATGPGQELYRYLRERGEEAALWEIPFDFSNRDFCRLTVFQDGKEWTWECPAPKGPKFWRYLRELSLTKKVLSLLENKGFSVDTYIGNGAFDTLTGIRKKIAKTVLFTIDYAPQAQPWYLRGIYRALDKYVCERAAAVWNLSPRMQLAREKSCPGLKCRKVLTVPHGTNFRRNALIRKLPANSRSLVFMGHLKADSGADLVLRSLPGLLEKFPDLTFTLAGSGPFEGELKKIAEKLDLGSRVRFTGFVESHDELEKLICSCAVGLALYNPERDVFSRDADPGKPKVYLGCGLPVIITDVPLVAREIAERRAGVVVEYGESSLLNGLEEILSDYPAFRAAAEKMGEDYDWEKIFKRALESLA